MRLTSHAEIKLFGPRHKTGTAELTPDTSRYSVMTRVKRVVRLTMYSGTGELTRNVLRQLTEIVELTPKTDWYMVMASRESCVYDVLRILSALPWKLIGSVSRKFRVLRQLAESVELIPDTNRYRVIGVESYEV